jgi:hypothetical protein
MTIIDRKLWLTADKDQVVEDGDPRASFLYATPGDELSDEDVKQYGIKVKAAPKADDKQAPAPANKAK